MADIADAYDNLVSRIGTLLSGHTRLPNPYDIGGNNDQFLKQGWGITVNPGGDNTQRFVSKHKSFRINFRLFITRKFFSREFDADAKVTTEKALLTDFETIIDDSHENNFNLGGPLATTTTIEGIDPVRQDEDRYLQLIVNIEVENFRV